MVGAALLLAGAAVFAEVQAETFDANLSRIVIRIVTYSATALVTLASAGALLRHCMTRLDAQHRDLR